RARICFTFYIAEAFCKVAAAAFVTIAISVVAATKFGINPNINELNATMIPFVVGIVINTLVGICAIVAAVFYKIRVWVHPHLRTILHDDLNYVSMLRLPNYGFNHAIFVIATALVSPLAVIGTVCMMIMTVGKTIQECSSVSGIILGFFVIFGGPLAMIPCYAWLSSRIIARNPQECWPDNSL
ncbi:MAG: hypothetical protein ABSA77_07995, partial [Thermoguttaceae bacterium]